MTPVAWRYRSSPDVGWLHSAEMPQQALLDLAPSAQLEPLFSEAQLRVAVEAEAQACADLCEVYAETWGTAEQCADAIRARGEK